MSAQENSAKAQGAGAQFEGHTPGPWFLHSLVGDSVIFQDARAVVVPMTDQNKLLAAAAPSLLKERDELKEQLENCKINFSNEIDRAKRERIARVELLNTSESLNAELLEALQAVYRDIELQNVVGGSDELNTMVQAAIAKAEGRV